MARRLSALARTFGRAKPRRRVLLARIHHHAPTGSPPPAPRRANSRGRLPHPQRHPGLPHSRSRTQCHLGCGRTVGGGSGLPSESILRSRLSNLSRGCPVGCLYGPEPHYGSQRSTLLLQVALVRDPPHYYYIWTYNPRFYSLTRVTYRSARSPDTKSTDEWLGQHNPERKCLLPVGDMLPHEEGAPHLEPMGPAHVGFKVGFNHALGYFNNKTLRGGALAGTVS